MAAIFDNVLIATYSDNDNFECASEVPHRLEMSKQCEHVVLSFYTGEFITFGTEFSRSVWGTFLCARKQSTEALA